MQKARPEVERLAAQLRQEQEVLPAALPHMQLAQQSADICCMLC